MKTISKITIPFLCALCLAACSTKSPKQTAANGNRYAQGFELIEHGQYTEALIYNPWQDSLVMQRFYLLTDTTVTTPSDGTRLRIPITTIATTSCTQIGFLSALNSLTALRGIASPQLVYTALPDSNWIDLGDAMQPNLERIVLANPEVIFLTAYQDQDKLQASVANHCITPIYINEWTEQHPLARAEWIRFFGILLGKETQADSIFTAVCEAYNSISQHAQQELSKGATILSGSNFRGTWYLPAANTYMGTLFADAGADYYYKDNPDTKSLPLSEEEVLLHFQDAQVWVGSNARSLNELAQIDHKHTLFRAYQDHQVYNFYKRTTPTGGNDFWESGVVHPERILNDLIIICHPDAYNNQGSNNQLFYSEQLQ